LMGKGYLYITSKVPFTACSREHTTKDTTTCKFNVEMPAIVSLSVYCNHRTPGFHREIDSNWL
jgi:hypothetical protein